jgi:NhaA family Na+:H+ antiporter
VAALPKAVRWAQISVAGMFAGIGFTMALFIAQLAFPQDHYLKQRKTSVRDIVGDSHFDKMPNFHH